jgi:hypothetical protein
MRVNMMVRRSRLATEKGLEVMTALCEGTGIRGTARLSGVAKNTVVKLLIDLGSAGADNRDKTLRNLTRQRLQIDDAMLVKHCGTPTVVVHGQDSPAKCTGCELRIVMDQPDPPLHFMHDSFACVHQTLRCAPRRRPVSRITSGRSKNSWHCSTFRQIIQTNPRPIPSPGPPLLESQNHHRDNSR